jgi:hypothetical protein
MRIASDARVARRARSTFDISIMTDLIAGLGVVLLLAALYLVRRHARHARRRRLQRSARSPRARTLSARTEMRACESPSTTMRLLEKRSRRARTETWNKA